MSQERYCEVVGKAVGFFNNKVEVKVDFGQEVKWHEVHNPLMDEDGKPIKFNSMIDALNHMAKNDWRFVNAYSLTIKNENVYHYVMRKIIV